MALVIDVGILIVTRSYMQTSADLGALAAAQNLDLDKLQQGEIVLMKKKAVEDATRWTLENLQRNVPELGKTPELQITVKVYNGSEENPYFDHLTGRMISDPTVCVVLEVPHKFYFIHNVFGIQMIRVHADASVLTKE